MLTYGTMIRESGRKREKEETDRLKEEDKAASSRLFKATRALRTRGKTVGMSIVIN